MSGISCAGGLTPWAMSESESSLVQAANRVGFLGPWGTFTEEALRQSLPAPAAEPEGRSGEEQLGPQPVPELIPFPSMHDTVDAVANEEVDCALVPIENSIEGSVSVTVDILAHETSTLQIVREIRHPIRHRLIARPGVKPGDISLVVSHPHATAQCRRWLRAHLPSAAVEAANSTADAVRRVAGATEPWAAVGTVVAARRYGCTILEDDIEDYEDNETRFVFLSRLRERQDLPEPYKTSVVCQILEDQPGALLLILQEFAHRYINLTKIESRPSKRRLGEYLFLVDMEGRVEDPQVEDALRCLACKLPRMSVLGSYPVGGLVPGRSR